MSRNKRNRPWMNTKWTAWGIIAALCVVPNNSRAEEYLVKGTAKFLGWEISDAKFRPCAGKIMEIGDGHVIKARERCGGAPPPGLARVEGTIIDLHPNKNIITVKFDKRTIHALKRIEVYKQANLKGGAVPVFIPKSAVIKGPDGTVLSTGTLQGLKTGYTIEVNKLVDGAAQNIIIRTKEKNDGTGITTNSVHGKHKK